MLRLFCWPFLTMALLLPASAAFADIKVLASIKPVQSLVAAIMKGAGTPGLIVKGAASLHSYSLKPSDAAALQDAAVVFRIGPNLEAFLNTPLEALSGKARVVDLETAPGLTLLQVRQGNGFDLDDDGDAAGPHDGHIWLDPQNAMAMVDQIAAVLRDADPSQAALYTGNAAAEKAVLVKLEDRLVQKTTPLKARPFIVFHDAIHYFENRFGVKAAGAIALNPENPPGAAALRALKQRIAETKISCVFSEPSFDRKLVDVLTEGTDVKVGVLDAEGALLEPGPELYPQMLEGLAASLTSCLSVD
jgi:zinc transport system substrate-binding protein